MKKLAALITVLVLSSSIFAQRQRSVISAPAPNGDTISLAVGQDTTITYKDLSYESFIEAIEYTQELLALQDTVICMASYDIYDIEFLKGWYEKVMNDGAYANIGWQITEDKDGRYIIAYMNIDRDKFYIYMYASNLKP